MHTPSRVTPNPEPETLNPTCLYPVQSYKPEVLKQVINKLVDTLHFHAWCFTLKRGDSH